MSDESRKSRFEDDPNYATLAQEGDYDRYFELLRRAFSGLVSCFALEGLKGSFESQTTPGFLDKLLYSVDALRLRYAHNPSHHRSLWVDLTQSGFPNATEISQLEVAMLAQQDQLRKFRPFTLVRAELLDHLMKKHEDSEELLWELSQRCFAEMLHPFRLFLPFTPGTLVRGEDKETVRSYVYSWGCYDFKHNRPYVHIMEFEQDKDEPPLDDQGEHYDRFLEVVRSEGSRVPKINILAMAIDDAIEAIRPMSIKRTCIGPLYSRMLLETEDVSAFDPHAPVFHELLGSYGRDPLDFVLQFHDEVVFSKRQQLTRSVFAPQGRLRQVFFVPEADSEAYEKGASVIHRYVLLPHFLLQHVPEVEAIPDWKNWTKLTYNDRGVVNGI